MMLVTVHVKPAVTITFKESATSLTMNVNVKLRIVGKSFIPENGLSKSAAQ
jgi:hypothetical protein